MMSCRHCGSQLLYDFLDLGVAPPSNAYRSQGDLSLPELHFPLRVKVCSFCWLVQTEDSPTAQELFTEDYAYFSSTSLSWLEHSKRFSKAIVEELCLDDRSFVIEIACNDGYLLQNFCDASIPCLGIEPASGAAAVAKAKRIPVVEEFFSEELGLQLERKGQQADLIIGNNVYAHVPDVNDFTRGLKAALKPRGTISLEVPHLMKLIELCQFDTVYHEHFSYFSLQAINTIFGAWGLRVFDVEELPTHGGSLRVYGCHEEDARSTHGSVDRLIEEEAARGLQDSAIYSAFQVRADKLKNDALCFLIEQKREGKSVVGYGAAAKGNTLLNYAGIKSDLLSAIYDAAESKQGKFMPGSGIPILDRSALVKARPDYVVILPWNLADEIIKQEQQLRKSGTRFAVLSPSLRVL
jgi:SAM-dependent methyltransferase